MEQPSAITIILLILNIFLLLTAFFGKNVLSGIQETAKETKEDIKRIFDKLDNYQTTKGCQIAHASHDKIHEMEQAQIDRELTKVYKDINNIGAISRKSRYVE